MATKKAATKNKATTPKKTAEGKQGRVSAYAGKKIRKLVKLVNGEGKADSAGTYLVNEKGEQLGMLRTDGNVRDCWDAISSGITVEKYRETAKPGSSLARKVLADFVAKGYVEVA